MADFLGNLVAKSLNLAPVLEPRPRSRYEPWQPAGARGFLSRNDDTSLEVSASRETASPLARARVRPIESARPESMLPTRKVKPDASLPPTLSSDAVEVERRLTREAQSLPITESLPVREANTPRAEFEADPQLPGSQLRIEHTHSTETLRVERLILEKELPDASFNLLAPRETISGKRDTGSRDYRAAPVATLLPRPVPSLIRTERAEPSPRTINVTIGRVEVRAVTSRPARKTARAEQVSTLEDYLRRSSKR